MVALSKGNIFAVKGNGYKDEIDCAYAIENYDLAIAAYQKLPDHSSAQNNLALVCLEKGNCLLELEQLGQAEENFKKSLQISTKNNLEEYEQYANLGLAKIDYATCNYQTSIAHLQALKNTEDFDLQAQTEKELYFLLKENHLALGHTETFHFFEKKHQQASQEIQQLENQNFRQVLKFIRNYSFTESKSFRKEKILLYSLLIICAGLIIFEITKSLKRKNNLE